MAEEIEQNNNKFYVGKNEDNLKTEITYKRVDNSEIEIDHTSMSDGSDGQGLGTKLVDAVVRHARRNNLRIIASCPFAKGVLEKNDSCQDVYLG